ncbi:MAG: ABC transporter ATP-binding protein [bacterium]
MQVNGVASYDPPAPALLADGAEPGTEYVLRVLGLEKWYRSGFWGRRIQAVSGISFLVEPGRIFALLGHNGAGKTTTLKAICNLVHADTGTIEIFGADHRDPAARTRLGYLPEIPNFYEHLTGYELLDYYGRLFGFDKRQRRRRSEEVLALVGAEVYANHRLRKYSKGMLQRLGLAQALLNDPELLILDEPMSGLDPLGRREVRELLTNLQRSGKTILLSSHIVPDVEALADTVAIIRQGQLHSLHDLRERRDAPQFLVSLVDTRLNQLADTIWASCATADEGKHGPALAVTLPDTETLAEFLDFCTKRRYGISGVQTLRRGLEEIFMSSLTAPAPGSQSARSTGLAADSGKLTPPDPERQTINHELATERNESER